MITENDVVLIDVCQEDVDYARKYPVPGHKNVFTGQLKTLGNTAMIRALGISDGEFKQQREAAEYLGSTYVCETRDGKTVGIDPAVLFVRDRDYLNKKIIVPANQLFAHNYLNDKYTVAVFVVGEKDEKGELKSASQVAVVGWVQARKLKRWISKDKHSMFAVRNVSLAVAPCQVVLLPMQSLLADVSHHGAMP